MIWTYVASKPHNWMPFILDKKYTKGIKKLNGAHQRLQTHNNYGINMVFVADYRNMKILD